ncbi:MAG: adenylate/guanylate cyclase domain-containing protein [Rhodospirillaceae bacterium]
MELENLARQGTVNVIVGFYGLTGYLDWCEDRDPAEVLDLAEAYFAYTGIAIEVAGGSLVKPVGDAGLCLFPPDDPDTVLTGVVEMKRRTDAWLAECGYRHPIRVGLAIGTVAVGRVGAPGRERLDVYGETVNRAGTLKGRPVAVTGAFAAKLGDDWRARLTPFGDGEFVLADGA